MKYMFMIYSQEKTDSLSPEEGERTRNAHWKVMQEAQEKGVLVAVEGLKPTSAATTVRTVDGKQLTVDGPFAETKEQLAGFYILECQDLDEALDWARRIPSNCRGGEGCIEIRPVADLPQRP